MLQRATSTRLMNRYETELDPFTDMTPVGAKEMINVMGSLKGSSDEWIILASILIQCRVLIIFMEQ